MNDITAFGIDLALTLLACFVLTAYLSAPLFRVLVDLCGTEERARFWLTFSKVLLIGIPAVTALSYRPELGGAAPWYFDVTHELSRTATSLLTTVIGLGLVITIFSAIAPRTPREKAS